MIRHIGVHGTNDTDIVDALGDFWENLADRNPGLSRTLELEGRFEKPTGSSLGFTLGSRRPLAMVLFQRRFGIESIHLGGTAIHEEVNDTLRLGLEMWRLGDQGTFRCQ